MFKRGFEDYDELNSMFLLHKWEFAEYLGISLSTLQGWIHYERVPEISMAYTIAFTLGVTLNYLLGGKETNIAIARQKELEARNAAAKILKLAEQIAREAKGLRPLKARGSIYIYWHFAI